jgi:cytochrome c oxidase cbb3-type subunit III
VPQALTDGSTPRLDRLGSSMADDVANLSQLPQSPPTSNRCRRAHAYDLSQGKRLYTWFNCKGFHADGGANSGPAFLDGWWRKGPSPDSIYLSIRDGRPRGMPSYRELLTHEQIWQLGPA